MAPLSTPHLVPTPQPQMFPTPAHLQTPPALEKQQMGEGFSTWPPGCSLHGVVSDSVRPPRGHLSVHPLSRQHGTTVPSDDTQPRPSLRDTSDSSNTSVGLQERSDPRRPRGAVRGHPQCWRRLLGPPLALGGLVPGTGVDAFAGRREKYHLPVGFGKTISENFLALCGK